jgi:nitrate reductase delta subunit
MSDDLPVSRVFRLFAALFEYPETDPIDAVTECVELLPVISVEAANKMDGFGDFILQASLGRLQEAYTNAFDLQPVSYPYMGYQLFGESYKRGSFMVGLKEKYREHGFPDTRELPDHLAILLRFLAVLEEKGERKENYTLVDECLVPSLEKMAPAFDDKGNPYGDVIDSLLATVKGVERDNGTRTVTAGDSTTGLQSMASAAYEEE